MTVEHLNNALKAVVSDLQIARKQAFCVPKNRTTVLNYTRLWSISEDTGKNWPKGVANANDIVDILQDIMFNCDAMPDTSETPLAPLPPFKISFSASFVARSVGVNVRPAHTWSFGLPLWDVVILQHLSPPKALPSSHKPPPSLYNKFFGRNSSNSSLASDSCSDENEVLVESISSIRRS